MQNALSLCGNQMKKGRTPEQKRLGLDPADFRKSSASETPLLRTTELREMVHSSLCPLDMP